MHSPGPSPLISTEFVIDGHVAVTVWGGLGNRLFMLAAGFSVARTLNRPMVVLSHHHETLSDVAGGLDVARLFGALVEQPRLELIPQRRHSIYVRGWQKARNLASQMHLIGDAPVRGGSIRRVETNGSECLVLQGYFQDLAVVRHAVDMGWPTQAPLSQADAAWLTSLPTQELPTVGVHVRRGDYLHKINQFRLGSPDIEYYRRGLECLYSGESVALCLFSDDTADAAGFLAAGGMHVDQAFGPADSPSEAAGLALMGMMSGLVLSNSTFSWWGAFWGSPSQGVVYPRPWHDRVDAAELSHPDWIPLPKHAEG